MNALINKGLYLSAGHKSEIVSCNVSTPSSFTDKL